MFKDEDKYHYRGTVLEYNNYNDLVRFGNLYDDKPPVLLKVSKALLNYIQDLGGTDEEERYIRADYYYGELLTVTRIEIPSKREEVPAKIIVCEDVLSENVIIFGEHDYIQTNKPEPMSMAEYDKWIKWKNENLR